MDASKISTYPIRSFKVLKKRSKYNSDIGLLSISADVQEDKSYNNFIWPFGHMFITTLFLKALN